MSTPFLIGYAFLWATLMRALFVKAQILPGTCGRCGLPHERRGLGLPVCRCRGD